MSEREKQTLERVQSAMSRMDRGQKERLMAYFEGAAAMVETMSREKNDPAEEQAEA